MLTGKATGELADSLMHAPSDALTDLK